MKDDSDRRWLACQHQWLVLARWRVNGIGGRQHGVVSTALCHFIRSNFACARHEAQNTSIYLVARITICTAVRYHADAQKLFHIARHKMSWPSIAHQYTALITLDRNMEADAAYQGCLLSCKLHSHNRLHVLTVRRYSINVGRYKLHMQIMLWDYTRVT